ncbi:universal stress protein [Mastigocoleus sp. MO_188.B34]|uniref:universal stress protein n=1 Tax=Mastigocoleus sp. MO_188.B34 TaxID=3036635 RepID=UPI002636F09F|nr:universal stress protein [Mastigocoleus sp. MO_188.B34]MDJ0696795.1 universal stress protein [Mastigocoleus sp. MO_188.B34]
MFKKILVALDSSSMNKLVFSQGLSLAKQNQANLMLLHVLSSEEKDSPMSLPPELGGPYGSTVSEVSLETWLQQWKKYESQCLKQLQKFTVEARNSGVDTEFRQITGSPGQMICDLAWNWKADLILVGNRGRSGLGELLLGSVSNYVLHHALCSVLTVKANIKPTP